MLRDQLSAHQNASSNASVGLQLIFRFPVTRRVRHLSLPDVPLEFFSKHVLRLDTIRFIGSSSGGVQTPSRISRIAVVATFWIELGEISSSKMDTLNAATG